MSLCPALLRLHLSIAFQNSYNPSMDSCNRANCAPVSVWARSSLFAVHSSSFSHLQGDLSFFQSQQSQTHGFSPAPEFTVDHSLALEMLPISVHTASCLRSLAERNGHLTHEDLWPQIAVILLRVQIRLASIDASPSIWSQE